MCIPQAWDFFLPHIFSSWRRQWHPTLVLLSGKSHERRSLVGCSPRGLEESDTTERLHFHFSLSCTGEGNGSPLQCSCLENPRGGGAWWAATYGVAQSRTQLKRLSSSRSTVCLDSSFLSKSRLNVTSPVKSINLSDSACCCFLCVTSALQSAVFSISYIRYLLL